MVTHPELPWATSGLATLLLYYLAVWWRVGRDPARGVTIPIYYPPENLSPAAMRYLHRMGYDHKTFAAALANLAVQGFITLEHMEGRIRVRRTEKGGTPRADDEALLLERLLTLRGGFLELDFGRWNYSHLLAAYQSHEAALEQEYGRKYFTANSRYLIPGLLLLIAIVTVTGQQSGAPMAPLASFVLPLWLIGWSFITLHLAGRAWAQWRIALRARSGFDPALRAGLVLIPFSLPVIGGIKGLVESTSLLTLATALGGLLVSWRFQYLLKAPTPVGNKLRNRIQGFRLFLKTVGRDELESKYSPAQIKAYVPYAFALDIEPAWAREFTSAFTDLLQ